MANSRQTVRRGKLRPGLGGEAMQARVREIVTAIAAVVIAGKAEGLGPSRRAMPLAMARGVRSGPMQQTRG